MSKKPALTMQARADMHLIQA